MNFNVFIKKVFDISPIYGSLSPGDSQQLTVTFFGHKEIRAIVKAVCQIENGPEYEMVLKGEASILSYDISYHFLDLAHIVRVFNNFKINLTLY